MSLIKHAEKEFKTAGWVDENGKFKDELQEQVCNGVMRLLSVFADEGHSGSTAPYALGLLKKLANFEPITPLTGEDSEWVEVHDGVYQNNRCGRVFKQDGQAYDIEGIVFYETYVDEDGDEHKSHFTTKDSRTPVTFPYTPTTKYTRIDG